MNTAIKIESVVPMADYRIKVRFSDQSEGVADLSHLRHQEVFRIWDDYSVFQSVQIDETTGAITWNDQVDIDTFNLYCKINGLNPEDAKD